jgi:hypothetical protein
MNLRAAQWTQGLQPNFSPVPAEEPLVLANQQLLAANTRTIEREAKKRTRQKPGPDNPSAYIPVR